jgi:hypothetical protein
VATQGVVELSDVRWKRFVSTTLQQLMKVCQPAPQARLVGFPPPLASSVVVARAVVGQAQTRQRLRPFPWPPRLALGTPPERHQARCLRLEGDSAFRQPRDQDALQALRGGAVRDPHDAIIEGANQGRLPV